MNRNRLTACVMLAGLLAGCGPAPVRDNDDIRIGSLQRSTPAAAPIPDVGDARQAAMREYQRFLNDETQSALRPEAMRRLADLHLELERQALIAGEALPGPSRSRAIELYNELLQHYPDYERNDSVLYQLARAYELNGEPELSLSTLSRYAAKFPDGDKIDEVQFRRGENLFAVHDYAAAEQAYQAVLDQGAYFTFHQQALYKMGWSRLKQLDYKRAVEPFVQLLDEALRGRAGNALPTGLLRADAERIDDTLRAISLCFASLGDSSEVERYFDTHGARDYEALIYTQLAELYLSKQRYIDAAGTYERFASARANDPEAPRLEARAIAVYERAGFTRRLFEEKQAYVEHYQPGADYWTVNDPAQFPDVLKQVRHHLDDITRHYHAIAQRRKTGATFQMARHWYRFYLRAFPHEKQTAHINFLYAELLTIANDHAAAAREYEHTAYDYGPHAEAAEAGYAALLAYEKHEATLPEALRAEWHRRGIDSALKFSATFPDHPQAMAARTRAAQELYALRDYTRAIEAATPITATSRAAPRWQLAAWTVIAHARFDLRQYAGAESAYRQVLTRIGGDDRRRPQLEDKLAASIYKQGEAARDAGNIDDATQHFLRVARIVPASSIAATARYDAAAINIGAGNFREAIGILQAWRRDYPDHELNDDVTRKLAVLYRDSDQPVLAAAEFERIADSAPDLSLKREASWTAATLYEQSDQLDRAIAAYKHFVYTFPRPLEQAMEARAKLVELYEQQGNSASQDFWRKAIIRADSEAGTERSDRTRFLAARAQLALTGPSLAAYRNVKLKEPLKQNLALKKQYMQKAINGLTQAATYGVAEVTTTSTYRIGELYLDFSKALMESERPHDLQGEELEQYNILLEEQAYPFEEKAIDVFETNVRHIPDGTYDDPVRKSLARLAEMLPVRYAKTERSETFVESR